MKNEHKESLGDKIGKKTAPFFEKIGNFTMVQRIIVCVVTFVLLSAGYVYFLYMPRQKEMKQLENELTTLETRLVSYKQKASALVKYEKMMAQAQARFNLAMKALPDKKEIPSLLTGISRSGSNAGLEFHLFQPKAEVQKEFYAEIPVAVKVQGRYHELSTFFDLVSRLYRIVNINDISIKSRSKSDGLEASCNAVTYMFVEKKKDVKK